MIEIWVWVSELVICVRSGSLMKFLPISLYTWSRYSLGCLFIMSLRIVTSFSSHPFTDLHSGESKHSDAPSLGGIHCRAQSWVGFITSNMTQRVTHHTLRHPLPLHTDSGSGLRWCPTISKFLYLFGSCYKWRTAECQISFEGRGHVQQSMTCVRFY